MGKIEDKDIDLHIDRETLLQEYIPRKDYERRLKADMVAMLEEIDARLTKLQTMCNQDDLKDKKMHFAFGVSRDVIQQKINALKENNHDY